MIRSYVTIAARRILKSKALSLIHVIGLSVGVSALFFIAQYLNFELSFDRFHPDYDQIFRVALERRLSGKERITSAANFAGLSKLVRENVPEVRAVTAFYKTPANTGVLFRYQGKTFNEPGGEVNADSTFFRVFPALLIVGDPNTVLNDPHSMVISASMAKKIFGNQDPIGQHLQRPDDNTGEANFVVSGVLRDIPANAHFHANFIVPLQYHWANQDEWQNDLLMTYVSLDHGSDPRYIEDRLNNLYRALEKIHPDLRGTRSFLQPLVSIHLNSHLNDELEANGSAYLLYVVGSIGLLILAIAWINYINLETARFLSRAREVGLRRIIGSGKLHLVSLFTIEYFLLFAAAVAVSFLMIVVALPDFSYLTGIPLSAITWPKTEVLLLTLMVLVTGSLLIGVYPAMFLLRLNPILALKGRFHRQRRNTLRVLLVTFQFCASVVVFGFLLVINNQLDFMRHANKKFDVEHVLAIRNPTAYSNEEVIDKHMAYRRFEAKLMELGSVNMVTSSSAIPGTEIGFTYVNLLKRNSGDPFDPTPYKTLFVDYNYIPFFGVKLLAGRNFDPPKPIREWKDPWEDDDWLTIVLNESAIHALGFNSPAEAVDQLVEFENFENFPQKHRIIGVIEDYHHEAVKKQILPMILSPNYGSFQQVYYSIRLHRDVRVDAALKDIKNAWTIALPDKPFEYFFLSEYYDRQFKSELQFKKIFALIASIAILIASFGILGMTLFESKTRVREISIRKVLGASITNLIALLSADHIRMMFSAILISVPVTWLIARKWLESYPLRIPITAQLLIVPVVVLVGIVTATAAFQTWKASITNPIDHLRNE